MHLYRIIDRASQDIVAEASGEVLQKIGFRLPIVFQGNERNTNTIELLDNSSVVFDIINLGEINEKV